MSGGWESRALKFRVRRKGEHPVQTDTCRDGVWVLSLAHVRQGPRAGGMGEGSPQWPHSCTALGKKQAQDVSSGAFLFSNLNSSSRRPFPAALSSVALRRPEKIQSKQEFLCLSLIGSPCYQISKIFGSTVLWRII